MARPEHMRGIDNLPSMQRYNEAYNEARYGSGRATRTIEEARALTKQLETLRTAAMRDKYGPANLTKTLNEQMKKETLWADQDSDCFESLSWRNGVATATFWHGGDLTYTYPVDLETFLEWANDDSLGGFFNDVIR